MKPTKKEVSEINKSHEKWLKSKDDGQRAELLRADFCHENLADHNYKFANLQQCLFVGADCAFTIFEHCNLYGADFSGADLTGANFKGANICGAKFVGAILNGATIEDAPAWSADFTGASITGLVTTGAELEGAVFSDEQSCSNFDSTSERSDTQE